MACLLYTSKDSRDSEVKEEDVENIPLSSSTGNPVTVGDVASVSRQDGFSSISHDGQERTVSAVSYTHLDVYKRQVPDCGR